MLNKPRKVKRLCPGDLVSTADDIDLKNPIAFVVSADYASGNKAGDVVFMLLGNSTVHIGKTESDYYFLFYRHEQNMTDPK